jgi:hypothetical protein
MCICMHARVGVIKSSACRVEPANEISPLNLSRVNKLENIFRIFHVVKIRWNCRPISRGMMPRASRTPVPLCPLDTPANHRIHSAAVEAAAAAASSSPQRMHSPPISLPTTPRPRTRIPAGPAPPSPPPLFSSATTTRNS